MKTDIQLADTIIIGGGVIGLCTALELAQRGQRVCVLERDGWGRNASWAGGGILAPLPPDQAPYGLETLLEESLKSYPKLCAQLHESTGIDPEYWISGAEYFKAGSSSWFPDIAQVRNPRLLKALRLRLEQLGVLLRPHTEVLGLQFAGDQLTGVRLPEGTMMCAAAVITAGAWSGSLADVSVRPIKGQMLLLRGRPGELSHILMNDQVYVIPRRDGRILIGSTLEDVGYDTFPTVAARNWLQQKACKLLPRLKNIPIEDHWAGLRPRPAAHLPFVRAAEVKRGVYYNTGHYRLGITLAPASARLLADLCTAV